MVTAKRKVSRRKKAEAVNKLPQPNKHLGDQAAQPLEQLVKGDGTSNAANLQLKMEKAATKFVDLTGDFIVSKYERGTRDLPYLTLANKVFGPHVYCTPAGSVLFRLGSEWIRLATETVAEAFGPHSIATKHADNYLTLARMVCKNLGRVGWTLPKLESGLRSGPCMVVKQEGGASV